MCIIELLIFLETILELKSQNVELAEMFQSGVKETQRHKQICHLCVWSMVPI